MKPTTKLKIWHDMLLLFVFPVQSTLCLKENVPHFPEGHLALCCGRCWQGRCPTRTWTPRLSSGEWETTVCSCRYLTAVQTASNCSWSSAGEEEEEFIKGNKYNILLTKQDKTGCFKKAERVNYHPVKSLNDMKQHKNVCSNRWGLIKHFGLFTGTANQETDLHFDKYFYILTSPPQIFCLHHKKPTFSHRWACFNTEWLFLRNKPIHNYFRHDIQCTLCLIWFAFFILFIRTHLDNNRWKAKI